MNNDPVKQYQALKKKPRSEEALQLLKRLASQVKPILIKHNWTIKNLCEFFPTNPNLLGVNVNRGWKINLRLRPHFDETQFLEYHDILGTLLHEMAHIVRGPHDEQFYKLLEKLKQETEVLMGSGYQGEGFYSEGHHLGSKSVPKYLSNQAAASAAEKRLQTSKIMLPTGGVKLGGSRANPHLTPAQLSAQAAQKRLEDKVWCGGSIVEGQIDSPSANSPVADNVTTKKRRLTASITPPSPCPPLSSPNREQNRVTPSSSSTMVIDLTKDEESAIDTWQCPSCTFENKPIALACEMCLCQKPLIETHGWICPRCTLENEHKWSACTACQYIYLR